MPERMKQVGVAWKKKTQDGKTFLSIVINNGVHPDIRLTMWTNSFKEKDAQPDFILYLSEDRPKPAAQPADEFPADAPAPSDDIPF